MTIPSGRLSSHNFLTVCVLLILKDEEGLCVLHIVEDEDGLCLLLIVEDEDGV